MQSIYHLQTPLPPGYLHGVEVAVAVEREADDVRGVVVPAGVDRVAHDVADLGEDVLDEHLVAAQRDALAEVGRHAHHQTLARARHAAQLPILPPALQLGQHGLQLEVARLLVQQAVVLSGGTEGAGQGGGGT